MQPDWESSPFRAVEDVNEVKFKVCYPAGLQSSAAGLFLNPLWKSQLWKSIRAGTIILLVSLLLGGIFPSQAAWARTTAPAIAPGSIQPYLDRVKSQITEFSLANGLKFIVLERHQAPVVSFLTYANVGGADEPDGQTGVAHYLEHLAFKGTRRIGTRDYAAEEPVLNRLDELFNQITAARQRGDTAAVQTLQAEFAKVEAQAATFVIPNQMAQIVNQAGGVGLNATTSSDATRYFYSFPANKLELWMSLESERFLEPVFREFYKEKEVILEERRMRTENSPIGKMTEAMMATAFSRHPYRRPVIGSTADIQNLTRQNVADFFAKYYVPSNLTIAVVGDVNPKQVQELASVYFGRYKPGPKPMGVQVVEPPQTATREVTLRLPSQPWYMEGYHIPSIRDPDYVTADMITSILSSGRTSRLYQSLVVKQQVALGAQGFNGFPGNKYPNLMFFYGLTAPGKTVDDVARALRAEIERLKVEPVSAAELQRVQKQARTALLNALDSNQGMAQILLEYQIETGDWRNLFRRLEAINAVTPNDILRFARTTFVPENRTVGKLLPQ